MVVVDVLGESTIHDDKGGGQLRVLDAAARDMRDGLLVLNVPDRAVNKVDGAGLVQVGADAHRLKRADEDLILAHLELDQLALLPDGGAAFVALHHAGPVADALLDELAGALALGDDDRLEQRVALAEERC